MKEFIAAVGNNVVEINEDEIINFIHEGTEVTFYQPGTGQLALMLGMVTGKLDAKAAGTFIALLFEMMEDETQNYFRGRLLDRTDGFDLEGDNGLMAIFEYLTEEWSAVNPTKEPSDYQRPRQVTGGKSTATTRAKGSTSSRSRSRVSSQ